MSRWHRGNNNPCPTQFITGLLLLSVAFLSACGGGSSTGSSGDLDPLVEDFGIAYVRQPLPDMDTSNVKDPTDFNAGSDLIFRDLAAAGARERNITTRVTGGLGDVKDVEASFDGSKLLFALRMPEIEGAAPEDQPTWNIWEYEIASDTLTRVIASDINAEAGQDVAPHYLADGRIIFSSTRQRTSKALLLDEGKTQFSALDEDRNEPALVLHVMNADGSDIHQVSFNQSHDLDPVVLQSGEVVFSRWDNMGSRDGIHLYKMYPDGTNMRLLYGAQSHATGSGGASAPVQFLQAREMPNGGVAVLLRPDSGTYQGGDIVTIDVDNYVENTQPTLANAGVLTGPAQVSAAFNTVRTDLQPSPGGRFNSFFPLWDGTDRILVSWTQCRILDNNRIVPCTDALLSDPTAVEAPPLYGVFIYDVNKRTQIPIFTPQAGILYRDVVAAQPRQLPAIHFDQAGLATESFAFDPDLVSENVGILNIRSVYDFDGSNVHPRLGAMNITALADPQATVTADDRPARFLRVVKAVGIPDRDLVDLRGRHFGVSSQQLMREIIGYAPVEPDGSVRVKVPANIPFAFSVLDRNGQRIRHGTGTNATGRHQSWLQLRPGEVITCNGCHDANSGLSHGRSRESFSPLNSGAPYDGYVFPNTETFFANAGETMAEARTRIDATALKLSVDIRYEDVWTDETVDPARTKDASFDYSYAALDPSLAAPVSTSCQTNWHDLCRIVINYEEHIHPLWNLDRGAGTCTNCHRSSAAGVDVVPDGQLDLTDGASDLNADHFKSYRELFSGDNVQELDAGGMLVDKQATDPVTGLPLFELDINGDPDPLRPIYERVSPSMSVAGAAYSARFFDRFYNPADADHFGQLSTAELKLLAEWLDIGGQYYNNPFDVPP